ncbi:MAG: polyprenol monophosphomannose synthase [Candidatus Magasanikbacteria bacterium]|nr:polyprenol monophosphomannose synthase [Candidatus Magasanikbacteria bacterium]
MTKIAIIIPTYNEIDNIASLTRRIFAQKIENLMIIFVDDNSSDGTGDEIAVYSKQFPVETIKRPGKLGIGSAYIAGFKKALAEQNDLIFEMDADLSHAPEDIPKMIIAADSGADLVIGSRKISGGKIIGWNLRRHLMSNGAMLVARLFLGLKTKDVTSGFRCYKKEVLEKINLDKIKSNGYAFQEEMLFLTEKLGLKVVEVPVSFIDRKYGKSKLSGKDILEFFKVMIKLH